MVSCSVALMLSTLYWLIDCCWQWTPVQRCVMTEKCMPSQIYQISYLAWWTTYSLHRGSHFNKHFHFLALYFQVHISQGLRMHFDTYVLTQVQVAILHCKILPVLHCKCEVNKYCQQNVFINQEGQWPLGVVYYYIIILLYKFMYIIIYYTIIWFNYY